MKSIVSLADPRHTPIAAPLLGLAVACGTILATTPGAALGPPKKAGAKCAAPGVQSLFDGRTLRGWEVLDQFDYSHSGKVSVVDGWIVLEAGKPGTGIRWTGPFPKCNYQVTFEAKRISGSDFFCAATFPVGNDSLTLVLGGWGGSVVGISSINGEPAVENETCRYIDFEQGRSYQIRLRVTKDRVDAWIDDEQVVALPTEHRSFSILWEVEPCLPFGLATWRTTGAVRNIRLQRLSCGNRGSVSAAAAQPAASGCP